ncbi:unnamed protein product, partial [Laminaria digitata]
AGGELEERGESAHIDSSGRRRKGLTYCQEVYRVDSVNNGLGVLEESCLVPFLQQLLENDSLLDVDRHAALYTSVFKLVRCIASWRSLHPLLLPMKGQAPGKSLYRLLSRLGDRAKVYRTTTSKGGVTKNSSSSTSGGKPQPPSSITVSKKSEAPVTAIKLSVRPHRHASGVCSSSDDDHGALTDLLLSAVQEVEDVVDASFVEELERTSITRPMETRASAKENPGAARGAAPAAAGANAKKDGRRGVGGGRGRGEQKENGGGGEGDEDWARYKNIMGPLQYVEVEDLAGFCFRKESETTGNRGNPQRVKRLGQEHADLSQSLPLSLSSSVFVRTHEDQMDWMQVMISGPDDTPYSGGLFAFDIFFPRNYPQSPPKVKLMTTGGGVHRFNPNLYADRTVCLSLLGAWNSDQ